MVSFEQKVCGGICCVISIVALILIIVSFHKVETNEVAFDWSHNSQTIDLDQLYTSGVYFLGVGHEFIKFKLTVQEIDFVGADRIEARTKDGVIVLLEGRLTYYLLDRKRNLASLYLAFGGKHTSAYIFITRSKIRDVAARYNAHEFFAENLQFIVTDFQNELKSRLADFHAELEYFTMKGTGDFPLLFERAVEETTAAKQAIETVQFEVESAQLEKDIKVERSHLNAEIILKAAIARASGIRHEIDANVAQVELSVAAETKAFEPLKSQLNFTSEELISYIWLDSLRSTKAAKTIRLSMPQNLNLTFNN